VGIVDLRRPWGASPPWKVAGDLGIVIIKGEPIKIVYIKPTEYLVAGIPLAVDTRDTGVAAELPLPVFQKDIEVEVPDPAPGLILNMEREGA